MQRARWTTSILVILLASAGALLVARRDTANAAKQDPPRDEPAAATPAADNPSVSVKPRAETASGAERGTTPEVTLDPSSLETIGALAAAHYFQTYLNIGFIADAKAKGTYSERDAYKVLDSVLAVLNSVDRKLARLDKVELDREDRASLDQMLQLSALLRRQAKELQTFWDTGRDEDAAQYEKVRKDSWAALSSLMGLGR